MTNTPPTSSFSHDRFLSPFTWRYGSDAMRTIWGEVHKRRTWRQLWVALAESEMEAGLVTAAQVADLRAHADQIDIEAAHAIEREIQHDLMAEVQVYAAQCPVGGGIIHLGATSMDIEDNADALRLRESLDLILGAVRDLIDVLAGQIERRADQPTIAFTHLQPAEPTTIGYRLALYGQDVLEDYEDLLRVRASVRGKGIKGAVGTGASYGQLLADTPINAIDLEAQVMGRIGLGAFPVAGQTYPRKQDWRIATVLAGLASTLYKFALDLRLLQSPAIGEWAEPFGRRQIGSSAMPFKRNPINAEKIDSLARLVESLVNVTWENASQSALERTLDDSANRREVLPVLFLATDEIIGVARRLIDGLRIDDQAVERNMQRFGTFAATERLMMEAVKAGADRQVAHEQLREHSLRAWGVVSAGGDNPLIGQVCADPFFTDRLPVDQIRALMDATAYIGDAPTRARALADRLRAILLKDSLHAPIEGL